MIELLAHRGPDHAAVHTAKGKCLTVTVGYCRLSILDLSDAGNQPMVGESGDVRLVYNGELYNHTDLRKELEALGHRYKSRSDTETVLHAYEEWGTAAFARFNGMFALAVHDPRRGTVILARDRRGIKPLYYAWDGESLAFASELKALVATAVARPHIDPTALWLYLCLGYVPSPHSMIRGVRKLEPGHFLELSDSAMRIDSYVREKETTRLPSDAATTVALVRDSVTEAVRRQLMSDVPVGVFLSGGLDSTIIAALASRHHSGPVHTFSAGYTDAGSGGVVPDKYNDDFVAAREVARALGTEHHEVLIADDARLWDEFESLIYQLDEPMVEPVFVTTHHLSRLARASEVPVVLTGDGADEIFGGYDRYFAAQRLARYRRVPGLALLLPFLERTAGASQRGRSARELRYLLSNRSPVDSYVRYSSIYHPDQALALLNPALRAEVDTKALSELIAKVAGTADNFVDQMARGDLLLWVGEHFNPRLDRISMLHSVEARVPFQDDAVVELAMSLPIDAKTQAGARKRLLRQAFSDVVPVAAQSRPKRPFQAPGRAWFEGGLAAGVRLLTKPGTGPQLFEESSVRLHLGNWGSNTPGDVFAVSSLLVATLWARRYLA